MGLYRTWLQNHILNRTKMDYQVSGLVIKDENFLYRILLFIHIYMLFKLLGWGIYKIMIFTLWFFFFYSSRAGERFAWTLLSFALTDVKQQRKSQKKYWKYSYRFKNTKLETLKNNNLFPMIFGLISTIFFWHYLIMKPR